MEYLQLSKVYVNNIHNKAGTKAIGINSDGVVTLNHVPAFRVRQTTGANAFSANAKATWNTVDLNQGGHWDSTNNRFIAPVNGIYFFSCMILSNQSSRLFFNFLKNGSSVTGTRIETVAISGEFQTGTSTMTIDLDTNDYVEVTVGTGGGYGGNYANFSGYLVG